MMNWKKQTRCLPAACHVGPSLFGKLQLNIFHQIFVLILLDLRFLFSIMYCIREMVKGNLLVKLNGSLV